MYSESEIITLYICSCVMNSLQMMIINYWNTLALKFFFKFLPPERNLNNDSIEEIEHVHHALFNIMATGCLIWLYL